MNRLEEIKNEYLKSLGYRNYDHLVADIKSGKSPIEKLILLEDDISEKYAEEFHDTLKGLVSDVSNLLGENDIEWQQSGYYEHAKYLLSEK